VFCYSDGKQLLCALRDQTAPVFRAIEHPSLADVVWDGPFPSEEAAASAVTGVPGGPPDLPGA
jgi:hypothetical protein